MIVVVGDRNAYIPDEHGRPVRHGKPHPKFMLPIAFKAIAAPPALTLTFEKLQVFQLFIAVALVAG